MMTKLSIIIPVYNTEQYLKDCLDSVVNQTYDNIEVLLIDDGSTDNSGKICDEYKKAHSNIKVVHKQNGGGGSARNLALDIATGDYITFVDSDDQIVPDAAWQLINLAEKYDADVVHCEVFKQLDNREVTNDDSPIILSKTELLETMLNDRIRSGALKMFRRETVGETRFPLDSSIDDMVLFSDIIERIDTMVISKLQLYYYRYNRPDNMSNLSSRFVRNVYERFEEYKKRYAIGKRNNCDVEETYKNAIVHALVFYAHYEVENNWLSERNEIEKYIKKNIFHILHNKWLSKRDKLKCCLLIFNKWLYKRISTSLKTKGVKNA